jgi:Tol biopolymer transport system component
MNDLKERFQSLDRVSAPDLWRDISRREPADLSFGTNWRRVAIAALAFLIAAAGIGLAARAFLVDKDARRVLRPVPITAKTNGKIAFVGGSGDVLTGQADGIYVMNPDGSDITKLRSAGTEPAWSPEGARLAYVVKGTSGFELHVVDVLSGRDSTIMKADEFLGWPTWSPDGSRLAVSVRGTDLPYQLYVMNEDGTDSHRITNVEGGAMEPDWSPDGTRIVFASATHAAVPTTWDLLAVRADGTGLQPLTNTPTEFESSPRWSPDGRRIAFTRQSGVGGPPHLASVLVMNADGSQTHSVYSCTACLGLNGVAWSPDGAKLIFGRSLGSGSQLWTMDADGHHRQRIDTGNLQACCVAWQPVFGTP